jgi:hypothetical protein
VQLSHEHAPNTDDALSWITVFESCEGLDVSDTDGDDSHRTAYEQLCTSYHAIDDFRAKLLGFLPLVTGGGLVLLTGRAEDVRIEFFRPVGIFGMLVTAGLLTYGLNGIKRCRELITEGTALEEKDLRLRHGQFKGRSRAAAFSIMTKPFAAALIYPSVLAAWAYLAFYFEDSHRRKDNTLALKVFVVAFAWIVVYDRYVQYDLSQKFKGFWPPLKQKILRKPAAAASAPLSPSEADEHAAPLPHQFHEKPD